MINTFIFFLEIIKTQKNIVFENDSVFFEIDYKATSEEIEKLGLDLDSISKLFGFRKKKNEDQTILIYGFIHHIVYNKEKNKLKFSIRKEDYLLLTKV